jgi:adenine deaminase
VKRRELKSALLFVNNDVVRAVGDDWPLYGTSAEDIVEAVERLAPFRGGAVLCVVWDVAREAVLKCGGWLSFQSLRES